jgi:hypothetical protein
MNLRFNYVVGLSLITLLIASCKDKPSIPAGVMPDIGIPPEEMNTKMHLTVPDGWNTFKIGDHVGLNVEVTSEDQIVFPPDFGARMFIYGNNQWKEVANFMTYPDGSIVLSPSNGNPFNDGATDVVPILPDTEKPATLRIILVGDVYRDGQVTSEKTAAYIDVNLTPK